MNTLSTLTTISDYKNRSYPEYTVSEISGLIKKAVEENFGFVRIKGEISGLKIAPSGHMYFSLKDKDAVLSAVCWKGIANALKHKPTDGLEVVCVGNITTYAGQSKYQMLVHAISPAGVGALMALLEKRKQQFIDEGLFDKGKKKPLPFMPKIIGVITSPTGAVIQDILHRIRDRFPTRVIIWPVLVQGELAAKEIAEAVYGFNNLPVITEQESSAELAHMKEFKGARSAGPQCAPTAHEDTSTTGTYKLPIGAGSVPRPDVIIVARGGGAIEDLWAFNEEIVVRAVFNSQIPIISAVGHETDTTLIDYVSDVRAPTPTAAAEMLLPVRKELVACVEQNYARMKAGVGQIIEHLHLKLNIFNGLIKNLPSILDYRMQKTDDVSLRFVDAFSVYERNKRITLQSLSVPPPSQIIKLLENKLSANVSSMKNALSNIVTAKKYAYQITASKLTAKNAYNTIEISAASLSTSAQLLESLSYKNTLKRGYSIVRKDSKVIASADLIKAQETIEIEFATGKRRFIASD